MEHSINRALLIHGWLNPSFLPQRSPDLLTEVKATITQLPTFQPLTITDKVLLRWQKNLLLSL